MFSYFLLNIENLTFKKEERNISKFCVYIISTTTPLESDGQSLESLALWYSSIIQKFKTNLLAQWGGMG